jgi:hypothetical protein
MKGLISVKTNFFYGSSDGFQGIRVRAERRFFRQG